MSWSKTSKSRVAVAKTLVFGLARTLVVGISLIFITASAASGSTLVGPASTTVKQVKSISILQNTAVPSEMPSALHSNFIHPLSASGCTGFVPGLNGEFGVCISVNGGGTYISTISTSGYALYNGCSSALLLRNGYVIKEAPTVCYGGSTTICWGAQSSPTCGTNGTMLSAEFGFYSSAWFHSGDVVCAEFVAEPDNGRQTYPFSWNGGLSTPEACETIY